MGVLDQNRNGKRKKVNKGVNAIIVVAVMVGDNSSMKAIIDDCPFLHKLFK